LHLKLKLDLALSLSKILDCWDKSLRILIDLFIKSFASQDVE